MFQEPYLLVAGCSHTAGVGIDSKDIWAEHVARHTNLKLINLSRSGSCAKFVSETLIDWLSNTDTLPALVIAQWPDPYRSMEIINGKIDFYNVNSANKNFLEKIKQDPNSFVQEWYDSIKKLNDHCQTKIINIYLQINEASVANYITQLNNQKITLHVDQKLPGKTWFFDSKARDGLHHSAECHRLWADRIISML